MERLIIFLFNIGLIGIYIFLAIIFGLVVQLINYKIFKFNLYKNLVFVLFKKER